MSTTTIPLIAVITGSNRGIGHAIVQTLSTHRGPSPLIIYATSRASFDLNVSTRPPNEIRYAKLDISSRPSIRSFLSQLPHRDGGGGGGKIDILINNAGVNLDGEYNYENARETFEVNYWGTRMVCELFLDEGGMSSAEGSGGLQKRIINISSGASQLTIYSASITHRFRTIESLSSLDAMAEEYLSSVRAGTETRSGWNHREASYSVSKAFLNAATFLLGKEEKNREVLLNRCCPGWVDTDMGRQVGGGGKDALDGARIPVRLAVGDIRG